MIEKKRNLTYRSSTNVNKDSAKSQAIYSNAASLIRRHQDKSSV